MSQPSEQVSPDYSGVVCVVVIGCLTLLGLLAYAGTIPLSVGPCNGGGLIIVFFLFVAWFVLFLFALFVFLAQAHGKSK